MEEHTPQTNTKNTSRYFAIFITIAICAFTAFFTLWLLLHERQSQPSGKIIFDDSVTEVERDFIVTNLRDIELHHNLTISSLTTTEKSNSEDRVLYDVLVATTDFYNPTSSVTVDEAEKLNLISILDLKPTLKLLAVDDNYYLDTFDSGAFFKYFVLHNEDSAELQQLTTTLANKITPFPNRDTVLTFAQTGVTALSRRMNTALRQNNNDATIFTQNIGNFLSNFDITHTSNESSFSNLANGNNICSDPAMIDVLTSIGLDIVELTGNHNQDCGDQDAIDTIQQYENLGIQTVGGGINAETAAMPLHINQKNTNITMLAYSYSTGGYTLDDTPGANFYTAEKAQADITAAKERGDFIIVDIQFFECNSYVNTAEDSTCDYADSAEGDQIGFFRHLIDLGADVVVGTAAHQPQTFELYKNGIIFYGLGNLFFDQSWWPGTTRSLILVHYFYQGQLLQTKIVPTVYDDTYQTKLLDPANATKFIQRLINARPQQ